MSLPAGVKKAAAGALVPVTQRGWWAPPYTSCMLAGLAMLLEWAGYELPLRRAQNAYDGTDPKVANFVWLAHKMTGRPFSSGTNLQDSQTALFFLGFPDNIIHFGTMTRREIREHLGPSLGAQIRFSCRPLDDMYHDIGPLPAGDGTDGGHALNGVKTRWNKTKGYREVKVVDPMFRPWTDYDERGGQWVPFDKFLEYADKDDDGEYIVTWSFKDAALV